MYIFCLLSHLIVSALGMISVRDFIIEERYITSLVVCDTARSSALVEEVVIVFCLFALYATTPLNNFII